MLLSTGTMNKEGDHNLKYSCSPSYRPDGTKYDYELGMPVSRFKDYPSDVRLKFYKNLGDSKREGMFIYGKIAYTDENDNKTKYLKDHNGKYTLDLRDAVGKFGGTDGDKWLATSESRLEDGDDNSGWQSSIRSIRTATRASSRPTIVRFACRRLYTVLLSANCARVRPRRLPSSSTPFVSATILPPTGARHSTLRKVQPSST